MRPQPQITQGDVNRLLDRLQECAINDRGITLEAIQVQTLLGALGGVVNEARAQATRLESLQHIANLLANELTSEGDTFVIDFPENMDVVGFTVEVTEDQSAATVVVFREEDEEVVEGEVVADEGEEE
jgi:hypothetical protein